MSSADMPPKLPSGGPTHKVQTRSFGTARTIVALMLREMTTRYSRTPGGFAWALLEPLGTIIVLGMAFALVIRTPSLGHSFILFYATAYLPFSLFNNVSGAVQSALKFSRPLLSYPSVTWMDAVLARFILNVLTDILVGYVLFAGIMMFVESGVSLSMAPILYAVAMAALLGLGVGAMNSVLCGLSPTWSMLWNITTAPLFLASGVLFIFEDMPSVAQDVLWYNPLIHITGMMRVGFYSMYAPSYISPAYVMTVALGFTALGFIFLRRYHKDILNL